MTVVALPTALVHCPRCKRDLHPGAFWKRRDSQTGRQFYCKDCLRVAKRGRPIQTQTIVLDNDAGTVVVMTDAVIMKLSERDRVLVGVLADAMRARTISDPASGGREEAPRRGASRDEAMAPTEGAGTAGS